VYDSQGNRVRKVSEKVTNTVTGAIEVEDKIYLGGVEIKRIRQNSSLILQRSTLHIMDDRSRIAISHNWSTDTLNRETTSSADLNKNKTRYQYGNHLGSASLELDTTGNIISYEEYTPYSESSMMVGNNQTEVKPKEYRYTGKERDDFTGLYYYGARYYAIWLGRWLKTDPIIII
jgi:RHS repeat-associated protein